MKSKLLLTYMDIIKHLPALPKAFLGNIIASIHKNKQSRIGGYKHKTINNKQNYTSSVANRQ